MALSNHSQTACTLHNSCVKSTKEGENQVLVFYWSNAIDGVCIAALRTPASNAVTWNGPHDMPPS